MRTRAVRVCVRLLLILLFGQLLSALITATGVFSQLLESPPRSLSIPGAQAFANYVLIALIFVPQWLRLSRSDARAGGKRLRNPLWMYIVLAILDVEANFYIVKAYQYTTVEHVILLQGMLSAPVVMLVAGGLGAHRYNMWHVLGVVVAIGGLVLLVLTSLLEASPDTSPTTLLTGDALCVLAALLYAFSNVLEESLLEEASLIEVLAFLGMFGAVFNSVQFSIVEHAALARIVWTVGLLLGFAAVMTLLYVLVPAFLTVSNAAVYNLSLTTSNMYAMAAGEYLTGFQPTWQYYVALACALCSVLVFVAVDLATLLASDEPGRPDRSGDEEQTAQSSAQHTPLFIAQPVVLPASSFVVQASPQCPSLIQFTPVYGANADEAMCYVLKIDEYLIMLDCGWNESFDRQALAALHDVAPSVDLVLLSHADLKHVGALPYLVAHAGLRKDVQICATHAVMQMGKLLMYDLHESRVMFDLFDRFTLDEVDDAFDRIRPLKYKENRVVQGDGADNSISVTPFNAGHMIGGAVWKISKDAEEVVYCVDYNHGTETLLRGLDLDNLQRPRLLIADSYNALSSASMKRNKSEFIERVVGTLRRNGNVLIPCDTAGRVLEILLVLEEAWRTDPKLSMYPIVFCSPMASNVLEFIPNQLEFMNERMAQLYEQAKSKPYSLVQTVSASAGLYDKRIGTPRVMLATSSSMMDSIAQVLLYDAAVSSDDLVVLIEPGDPGTVARSLYDMAATQPDDRSLQITLKSRVNLEGDELEQYMQRREAAREERRKERELRRQLREQERQAAVAQAEEDQADGAAGLFSYRRPIQTSPQMRSVSVQHGDSRPIMFGANAVPSDNNDFFGSNLAPYVFSEANAPNEHDGAGEDGAAGTSASASRRRKVERRARDGAAESAMEVEGADARDDDSGSDSESGSSSDDDDDDSAPPPQKCISRIDELEIICDVAYVDLSGRSSQSDIQTIVSKIAPLKLIIVHGSAEASQWLASHVDASCETFIAKNGANVNVTFDTDVFKVVLTDQLLQGVAPIKLDSMDVTWLTGDLVVRDAGTASDLGAAQDVNLGPCAGGVPPHSLLVIGDLKLTDLRTLFSQHGLRAVLARGRLIVNGELIITKDVRTRAVQLEGVVSPLYFTVRDLLYLHQVHVL